MELSTEANMLNQMLLEYTRYNDLSQEIRPELTTLFPQIHSLALARATEVDKDTVMAYVVAIIGTEAGKQLTAADQKKLCDWLKARTQTPDSLAVIQK